MSKPLALTLLLATPAFAGAAPGFAVLDASCTAARGQIEEGETVCVRTDAGALLNADAHLECFDENGDVRWDGPDIDPESGIVLFTLPVVAATGRWTVQLTSNLDGSALALIDFTAVCRDGDEDGACDAVDLCEGDDALGDEDGDGACGAPVLPSEPTVAGCAFGPGDDDGDGICDERDLCAGVDAAGDKDGNGACDDEDRPARAVLEPLEVSVLELQPRAGVPVAREGLGCAGSGVEPTLAGCAALLIIVCGRRRRSL